MDEAQAPTDPTATLSRFQFTKLLNQDQSGRRLVLLGSIDSKPSLLTLERAAFPSSASAASVLPEALTNVTNLGANDVYYWYMASIGTPSRISQSSAADDASSNATAALLPPDLKINLIHPCVEKHIKKYTPQTIRVVTETPFLYKTHVAPLVARQRTENRMAWIYNILEGRTEQEDIIHRSPSSTRGDDPEGFLLLPDMNWDRKTMSSLRILGLVERRDLGSLRDLRKSDVPWLKDMLRRMVSAVVDTYKEEGESAPEEDTLKVYVHYQPTYYHFHVHIVAAAMEPNATQAVGKAFSLPNLISQLETMAGGAGSGMQDVELTYTVGEASDLWTEVYGPVKEGAEPRHSSPDA
ncbi:hypothetical protein MMC10_010042 [Thelotrema lepadinum]|nr:hypothetical protein [Thelotrema lepadinum]